MLVTQEQAREMWCPEARSMHTDDAYTVGLSASYNRLNSPSHKDDLAPKSCRCIASKCMFWRWGLKRKPHGEVVERAPTAAPQGYCGLAGKP